MIDTQPGQPVQDRQDEVTAALALAAEARRILAAAMPGPWTWMEERFNGKYPGRSRLRWLFLLCGPIHNGTTPDLADEHDHHQIMAVRWESVRGSSFIGGPGPRERALIGSAPTMMADMATAIERLSARCMDLQERIGSR
jgi:hypothetical protein